MPTLSMTIRMTRRGRASTAGSGMAGLARLVRGVVAADAARRADGRDGVLEDQVVDAAVIHDQGEAIEVLDPPFHRLTVEELNHDGQLLAAGIVQEDVLDVRRPGRLGL